ncbi:hypothetical protein LOZ59_004814 [Ophidiomyces ophidiicola]|nr:hypothetical protein LOZ59_004814 [Ophidiomyces ophidiicola]
MSSHSSRRRIMKKSLEEAKQIVLKRMKIDCKVDACIDRYNSRALALKNKRPNKTIEAPEAQKELSAYWHQKQCLKEELIADLDNLVPEYGEVNFPESATALEKYALLKEKVKGMKSHVLKYAYSEPYLNLLRASRNPELVESDVGEEIDTNSETEQAEGKPKDQLDELRYIIKDSESKALFTCGGSVNIVTQRNDDLLRGSLPITFYWTSEGKDLYKTMLPEDNSRSDYTSFQMLVDTCTPATFGLGQQDVLDPSYRHAGKLDVDRFCSTFHPADFGILESIEQTLLPNISSTLQNQLEFRRVKAELYKLNVYSGPSGVFRAHVDTPRSSNQFGSLVVCLPSPIKEDSVEFAWDKKAVSDIQWAAFYSDCELEIERVTEGHRVTLTYNLFITEPVAAGIIQPSLIDPCSLPLYGHLDSLLSSPRFMNKGGVIGIYCSHSYPHTSDEAEYLLPRKLKGSDMAIYAALKSLGLWVTVRPILSGGEIVRAQDSSKYSIKYSSRYSDHDQASFQREAEKKKNHITSLPLTYHTLLQSQHHIEDIHQRWKHLYVTRLPSSIGEPMDVVGTDFHPNTYSNWHDEITLQDVLEDCWPNIRVPGITWVNEPAHEKPALYRLIYGNEASIQVYYSNAAILAIIPPWK